MSHRRDNGRQLLGNVESFPGFNMAMIFDFLHIAEIFFNAEMPLLYSSSLNYSAVGDSTDRFSLLDVVPLLLMSNLIFAYYY